MKITLEPTDRFTTINGCVAARIWRGTTEKGIEVFALIPVIAAHKSLDQSELERALREIEPPAAEMPNVFPAHMVL